MAEKKIGTRTFRAEKMAPREAQRLLLRLGKLMGPAISHLSEVLTIENEQQRDRETVQMIGGFLTGLDVDEADTLIVELVEGKPGLGTEYVGGAQVVEDGAYRRCIFDHDFQDSLMDAWKVAAYVLEVQFRDFFSAAARTGAVQNLAGRLQMQKPAA